MTQGKPSETCGEFGGRRNNGEPCGRASGWGTPNDSGRCRACLGTAPDGGTENHGAPENNANAVKHNQSADKSKLWERMGDSRKELWSAIRQAQIDRHKERHGQEPNAEDIDAYEDRAWSAVLKKYARDYMAECMEKTGNPLMERVTKTVDGEKVTYERPNQLLNEITDNRREDRLAAKDRGMLNDPETQKAEAVGDATALWMEELSE